jgi:hypothetical protein
MLTGLLAITVVAGITSCSSESVSTSSVSTPPTESSRTRLPPAVPHREAYRHCDANVLAGSHASCGFTQNTFKAYAETLRGESRSRSGLSYIVEAQSPATGRSYNMDCRTSASTGGTVTCVGASSALVRFPLRAARAYHAPTSAPMPKGEAPVPTGQTDRVGSSSHAGDTRFCSQHQCIGSFMTESGTVVKCADKTYSHAGGISGACSHHGGEASGATEETE